MTTITDADAAKLSAPERLSRRWDETAPLETRPPDDHEPKAKLSVMRRLALAWRAGLAAFKASA